MVTDYPQREQNAGECNSDLSGYVLQEVLLQVLVNFRTLHSRKCLEGPILRITKGPTMN